MFATKNLVASMNACALPLLAAPCALWAAMAPRAERRTIGLPRICASLITPEIGGFRAKASSSLEAKVTPCSKPRMTGWW